MSLDSAEVVVGTELETLTQSEEIGDNNTMMMCETIPSITNVVRSDQWGVLRSKGLNNEKKLVHRTKDGRKDTYFIGRGLDCDIIVNDRRISTKHCLIYCDYSQTRMRVFLEDCSANGTYVNDSLTRIARGLRMELKSGDEIFLINPRSLKAGDYVGYFMFINMRDRLVAPRDVGLAPTLTTNDHKEYFSRGRHIEDVYAIGDQLGAGVCGQVHLCVHRETRKQCAVKIIDTRKFSLNPGLSPKEIREEAEMMRFLNHPNIIRIQDSFETEHVIYIVMELVKGGDLFDRIVERGKYSEVNAREVMKKILHAVVYLHSKDIVHRDLKPENILLVYTHDDTEIKITDFGLAKRTNQEGLKTFCGTPQYFAPEVLRRKGTLTGTGRYGREADMWSIGVILYILLSGGFPFDEDQLFDQIEHAQYSLTDSEWTGISDEAKHMVRSLLTLQPGDRLNAQAALQHPWIQGQSLQTLSMKTNPCPPPTPMTPATPSFRQLLSPSRHPPPPPPVPTFCPPPTSPSIKNSKLLLSPSTTKQLTEVSSKSSSKRKRSISKSDQPLAANDNLPCSSSQRSSRKSFDFFEDVKTIESDTMIEHSKVVSLVRNNNISVSSTTSAPVATPIIANKSHSANINLVSISEGLRTPCVVVPPMISNSHSSSSNSNSCSALKKFGPMAWSFRATNVKYQQQLPQDHLVQPLSISLENVSASSSPVTSAATATTSTGSAAIIFDKSSRWWDSPSTNHKISPPPPPPLVQGVAMEPREEGLLAKVLAVSGAPLTNQSRAYISNGKSNSTGSESSFKSGTGNERKNTNGSAKKSSAKSMSSKSSMTQGHTVKSKPKPIVTRSKGTRTPTTTSTSTCTTKIIKNNNSGAVTSVNYEVIDEISEFSSDSSRGLDPKATVRNSPVEVTTNTTIAPLNNKSEEERESGQVIGLLAATAILTNNNNNTAHGTAILHDSKVQLKCESGLNDVNSGTSTPPVTDTTPSKGKKRTRSNTKNNIENISMTTSYSNCSPPIKIEISKPNNKSKHRKTNSDGIAETLAAASRATTSKESQLSNRISNKMKDKIRVPVRKLTDLFKPISFVASQNKCIINKNSNSNVVVIVETNKSAEM